LLDWWDSRRHRIPEKTSMTSDVDQKLAAYDSEAKHMPIVMT